MSSQPIKLVVFTAGQEEYALPIGDVREIILYTEPRSVASSDPSVRGVISLRGKILPVYDLLARLGLPGTTDSSKIIILEAGERTAGVIVSDVSQVRTVDDLDATGGDVAGAGIDAIIKIDDRLLGLLNTSELLGDIGPVGQPLVSVAIQNVPAVAVLERAA